MKFSFFVFLILFSGLDSKSPKLPEAYTDKNGQLNYASLDFWYPRKVKESSLLSGKTIELFEVGKVEPNSDSFDLKLRDEMSPWGTTNIYAKMILDVGNSRVLPEKHEKGYCARLETKIRKDNILGLKLEVLIAGTLFLGEKIEPVKGLKDPIKNVSQGIPFDKKPKAVKFDYKYHIGEKRVEATYNRKEVDGEDKAEFCVILQKRWEDEAGNVFATRIGGIRKFFTGEQSEWISNEFPVFYGDPTHLPEYNPKTMGLIPGVAEVYVFNSKNILVPLTEINWGKSDDIPTHMIMYFTSSYEGVQYIGSPESVFWVDNIEFIY